MIIAVPQKHPKVPDRTRGPCMWLYDSMFGCSVPFHPRVQVVPVPLGPSPQMVPLDLTNTTARYNASTIPVESGVKSRSGALRSTLCGEYRTYTPTAGKSLNAP